MIVPDSIPPWTPRRRRAQLAKAPFPASAATFHRVGMHDRPRAPNEQVTDGMPPETRYDVTLDEIRELVRNGDAVIIDARWPADFARGHVRGAFNMPAGGEEAYMLQIGKSVTPNKLIIIYCNGPRCRSSDMVYAYLAPRGYTNMRVFKPGWDAMASARAIFGSRAVNLQAAERVCTCRGPQSWNTSGVLLKQKSPPIRAAVRCGRQTATERCGGRRP